MGTLRLEPLEKALKQLPAGLEIARRDPGNELLRDGVIQRLEYSVDLCWKFLQRYLKEIAQVEETELRTKKDLFREGARRGLLADAAAWIGFYEARCQTSHAYNPARAQEVYQKAGEFYAAAVSLLGELKKC